MTCDRAHGLFGACWDDELTQAERDWLEAHFASCVRCRNEYDEFSRALELTAALPRVEAAPGLVERVLARTRRASAVPDRVERPAFRWAPVAAVAAAAVIVIAVVLVVPRMKGNPAGGPASAPVALQQAPAARPAGGAAVERVRLPERRGAATGEVALIPDSVFDHTEDVEFILDPVTLHRGRASVRSAAAAQPGVQGQQAIITF